MLCTRFTVTTARTADDGQALKPRRAASGASRKRAATSAVDGFRTDGTASAPPDDPAWVFEGPPAAAPPLTPIAATLLATCSNLFGCANACRPSHAAHASSIVRKSAERSASRY